VKPAAAPQRRTFVAKRLVAVLAIVLSACTGSHHGASPSPTTLRPTQTSAPGLCSGCALARLNPTRYFDAGKGFGLSFWYPRTWSPSSYRFQTSFTDLIVYLSNVPLHNPCRTTNIAGVLSTTCHDPVRLLPPGGVIASWSNVGYPHPGPEITDPNMTISGRPASLVVGRSADCSRIGGQETITAEIARPVGNHYEMVACLRSPNAVANEKLVRQMIASVHVSA